MNRSSRLTNTKKKIFTSRFLLDLKQYKRLILYMSTLGRKPVDYMYDKTPMVLLNEEICFLRCFSLAIADSNSMFNSSPRQLHQAIGVRAKMVYKH